MTKEGHNERREDTYHPYCCPIGHPYRILPDRRGMASGTANRSAKGLMG